jgi:putative ABC transport system permease protein
MSAHSGKWGGPQTIIGGNEPVRAYAVGVFRDFFKVFDVSPALGRTFSPEESNYGTTPVAVVSYRFWQHNLGADPKLTDHKLTIEGMAFNVIGVMPAGFSYPEDTDVWISREQLLTDTSARSSHNFAVVARLKPNVTIEQARAETRAIAHRIAEADPTDNEHNDVALLTIKDQLTGSFRLGLIVLLAAVGCVLLIACANVANLQLARAVSRTREIAIRNALGASRRRIVRQLLTESLLLASLGGLFGLLLAYWMVSTLVTLGPTTIPRLAEIGIDGRTLIFTFGVTFLSSLLSGLAPALRSSTPDLNETLKESGRGVTGGTSLLRGLLVSAQFTLTLLLLIGAGLLLKSLWHVLQVDPGFNSAQVLTVQLSLPTSEYPDTKRSIGFYSQLFDRLRSVPGIEEAGMVNNLPLGGVDLNGQLGIAGRSPDRYGYASYRVVSPGYFRVMQIPLIRGRYFAEQDGQTAEPVALISQRLAETTFKGEDPIDKRIMSVNDAGTRDEFEHTGAWPRIVGVVSDVKHSGLERGSAGTVYVSYLQRPRRISDMTIVIRGRGAASDLAAAARQEIGLIDKNLPMSIESMDQVLSRSTANRRYNVMLLAVFAAVALLLASIGIYGVMSYVVSQNTREFGIRIALGARTWDVLKLVLGQGVALAGLGVILGVGGAFALTRWLRLLLFEVSATDPTIFVGVALLLVLVALLACCVPARRALKVDPIEALRHE